MYGSSCSSAGIALVLSAAAAAAAERSERERDACRRELGECEESNDRIMPASFSIGESPNERRTKPGRRNNGSARELARFFPKLALLWSARCGFLGAFAGLPVRAMSFFGRLRCLLPLCVGR